AEVGGRVQCRRGVADHLGQRRRAAEFEYQQARVVGCPVTAGALAGDGGDVLHAVDFVAHRTTDGAGLDLRAPHLITVVRAIDLELAAGGLEYQVAARGQHARAAAGDALLPDRLAL